jgi:hypothetical protein
MRTHDDDGFRCPLHTGYLVVFVRSSKLKQYLSANLHEAPQGFKVLIRSIQAIPTHVPMQGFQKLKDYSNMLEAPRLFLA